MQHHFDGIIFPENDQDLFCAGSTPSRREVLRTFVAGGTAALALADSPLTADDSIQREKPTPADYDRFVVVPKDFRRFSKSRRQKLGVGGGYFRIFDKKSKKPKAGYLAWLTKDAAKALASEADVVGVHRIKTGDVAGPGPRRGKTNQLAVQLLPNGWQTVPPKKGTYVSTSELIDAWSKQFKTVKFKPTGTPSRVLISIGPAGMPEALTKKLKAHPQVARLYWNAVATTLALGEEGATTKALGEEGASTRRRGEEGGKVTTLRVGEEGGKVTTKALGEEGASTRALGEEGGKRPPKRGRATTLALGEEGGGGKRR